jgi:hypothetical protein
MLTAHSDAGRATTRYNDVVNESRERGNAANEEGCDGAPVAGIFGRVAVDAVEVVHIWHGHITASDDIVAATRNND